MFDRPAFSKEPCPYFRPLKARQAELAGHPRAKDPTWLWWSLWGQRISSLVPFRGGLAVGLGNMRGQPFDPERDTFLPEGAWRDYGRVKYVKGSHSVIAEIAWKDGPTRLSLVSTGGYLCIVQDGAVIGWTRASIPAEFFDRIDRVEVGRGIFGRAGMKISNAATGR